MEISNPPEASIKIENTFVLIEEIVPLNICLLYKLVPLQENHATYSVPSIVVGMVTPDNMEAQDVLYDLVRRKKKGFIVQEIPITIDEFKKIINIYLAEKDKYYNDAIAIKDSDMGTEIQEIEERLKIAPSKTEADTEEIKRGADEAPVINLVNKIIVKAITEKASDIHVEPQEDHLKIRFRRDGILSMGVESLPKKITASICARFKLVASLDISERRLPQDGRMRRSFLGVVYDFRVSSIPGKHGEKIVLRILETTNIQLGLDKLITNTETVKQVRDMIAKPYGLILVTGPTGSGKTTTLYSAISELNTGETNISTIEDPVEYSLPGINQIQVVREKGLDFDRALRALLRQDPDVILVGEIRDRETAKTTIEAALTGHLVLTTLHTNDAASAIARLTDIGVDSFLVASSLVGIIAQRLLRKVCLTCRELHDLTDLERHKYQILADTETTYFKAKKFVMSESSSACVSCKGRGYKGRVGVYEILVMNGFKNIRKAISDRATTEELTEVAVADGMKTLLKYSLELAKEGVTTLEEVARVTLV